MTFPDSFREKTFCLVIGLPRGGTSFTCDIVKKAGFNFGNGASRGRNPRDGRHEIPHFTMALLSGNAKDDKQIIREGIQKLVDVKANAAKKLQSDWALWLPTLSEVLHDLRIVVVLRDRASMEKSSIDYAYNVWRGVDKKGHAERAVRVMDEALARIEGVLANEAGYHLLPVDMARLCDRDNEQYSELRAFLGVDVPLKDLMDCARIPVHTPARSEVYNAYR